MRQKTFKKTLYKFTDLKNDSICHRVDPWGYCCTNRAAPNAVMCDFHKGYDPEPFHMRAPDPIPLTAHFPSNNADIV